MNVAEYQYILKRLWQMLLFFHSFIHLFIQIVFVNTKYISGAFLGISYRVVNKTENKQNYASKSSRVSLSQRNPLSSHLLTKIFTILFNTQWAFPWGMNHIWPNDPSSSYSIPSLLCNDQLCSMRLEGESARVLLAKSFFVDIESSVILSCCWCPYLKHVGI